MPLFLLTISDRGMLIFYKKLIRQACANEQKDAQYIT